MLKDLEENKDHLGILNYGISLTTMEEVFMKVGADHGQEELENALELQKDGVDIDIYNENVSDLDLNRQSSDTTRKLIIFIIEFIRIYWIFFSEYER